MANLLHLWPSETEKCVFCARVIPAAPPLTTHSNTSASIFPICVFSCSVSQAFLFMFVGP